MKYKVADIIRDVRIAIDQNTTSDALLEVGDVDTLSLEEIIRSKIVDAATIVEAQAPVYLLDGGKAFGDSILWDSQPGIGSGEIHLPDDFLRLVCFRMSDWEGNPSVITEDDPKYAMQHSRYAGIRGNPQNPVVAIVTQPIGQVLEFYSCTAGEQAYVKQARYIPIPRIEGEEIEVCEKLRRAIVYYAAYLTALSVGNGDLATAMQTITKEILK